MHHGACATQIHQHFVDAEAKSNITSGVVCSGRQIIPSRIIPLCGKQNQTGRKGTQAYANAWSLPRSRTKKADLMEKPSN